MLIFILSFLAGVLTIAAPCVFTLLPVIVGGSVARSGKDKHANFIRPIIVATSLVVSIVLFTLLLKVSTSLLGVPSMVWQEVAGLIIIALGVQFLGKEIWAKILSKSNFGEKTNRLLGSAYSKNSYGGDVLIGLALGPVFSSCSPTYAFLVASILPVSFAQGMLYLLAYAIGLAGMLLVVAYAGQSLAIKLGWLANPEGKFRKFIGILFIIVGTGIILGLDKKLESNLLNSGLLDPLQNLERNLMP